MSKKKSTNAATIWVPSEFEQADLTKAQKEGFLVKRDRVIFPSSERIPKPPSGYRVMFAGAKLTWENVIDVGASYSSSPRQRRQKIGLMRGE
jgi:hypothetical protein